MTDYNRLFDKKFKGCPLLAVMDDEARGRNVKIFYIDDPLHVGVFDGVDTWVSPVKGCFHYLKEGLLDSQIALAVQGKIAPEATVRKTFNKQQHKVFQKREMTHG